MFLFLEYLNYEGNEDGLIGFNRYYLKLSIMLKGKLKHVIMSF